ncbi:MAG TPA: hypothetical protein VGS78_12740 [Candidatus Sulfotelmatobacter sp.]|nr:hypothetical protein [Candidatus Sulfotelmatobacter sp.]
MRYACVLLILILVAFSQTPNQTTPYWAYALDPPSGTSQAKADSTLHHVPRSDKSFTTAQTEDLFNPPDWHPAGHPPMPEVVAYGRKPAVYACGYCHLPNGEGRPENAALAGLSASYIVRQIDDFRSGARKTSEPHHLPAITMASIAVKSADPDIRSAAEYFSRIHPKPWIRVVETATVPKTQVSGWMLVPTLPPATEPIGRRIIEIPENLSLTELRDDDSGFIAYVPEGSLRKGRSLVVMGSRGKTVPCANCHGQGLHGSGNVPPIAGRSPSYIIRQLYDIRSGARSGVLSKQMLPQVRKLEMDDMIDIAAFVSSLKP